MADVSEPSEEPRDLGEEDAFFAGAGSDSGGDVIVEETTDLVGEDTGDVVVGDEAEAGDIVVEETGELPAEADLLAYDEYDEGEGGETPAPAERRRPAPPPPHRERSTAKEFVREVRGELKKVAWPTKAEVITSTIVVLVAVIIMTVLIFGLDWAFSNGVLELFEE